MTNENTLEQNIKTNTSERAALCVNTEKSREAFSESMFSLPQSWNIRGREHGPVISLQNVFSQKQQSRQDFDVQEKPLWVRKS